MKQTILRNRETPNDSYTVLSERKYPLLRGLLVEMSVSVEGIRFENNDQDVGKCYINTEVEVESYIEDNRFDMTGEDEELLEHLSNTLKDYQAKGTKEVWYY